MRRAPPQREVAVASFNDALFTEFDVLKVEGKDAWLRSIAAPGLLWGKLVPLTGDRLACLRASELTLQLVVLTAGWAIDQESGFKISLDGAFALL